MRMMNVTCKELFASEDEHLQVSLCEDMSRTRQRGTLLGTGREKIHLGGTLFSRATLGPPPGMFSSATCR